jgi:hypothetical protein
MTVAELMAALAAYPFSAEVIIRSKDHHGWFYATRIDGISGSVGPVVVEPSKPLRLDDPLANVLTDTRLAEPSTADKIRALGVGQSILLDKPQTSVSSYAAQIGRRLGRRYKTKQSKDRSSTTVVRIS